MKMRILFGACCSLVLSVVFAEQCWDSLNQKDYYNYSSEVVFCNGNTPVPSGPVCVQVTYSPEMGGQHCVSSGVAETGEKCVPSSTEIVKNKRTGTAVCPDMKCVDYRNDDPENVTVAQDWLESCGG